MNKEVGMLKALGDSTRIRMIKLLEGADELCVCEIIKAMDISQSRASRNLNILRQAGLVTDRRSKMWVYYSLNRGGDGECCKGVFSVLKNWFKNDPLIKQDNERLAKFRKALVKK
jgi:ArsR family transcriptional regulator